MTAELMADAVSDVILQIAATAWWLQPQAGTQTVISNH